MPPIPNSRCARCIRSTGSTRPRTIFSVFRAWVDRQTARVLTGHALRYRSIVLTQTLLLLAGVLLGKASLDWLYGLIGGPPQTAPQFWRSRFGRDQGPAAVPNDSNWCFLYVSRQPPATQR